MCLYTFTPYILLPVIVRILGDEQREKQGGEESKTVEYLEINAY